MFGKIKSGQDQKSSKEDNLLSAAVIANANETIQDKIVNYFINQQNPEALTTDNPAITPEQRTEVSQNLSNGQITTDEVSKLLQQLPTPLQSDASPTQIFQQIASNLREKQILAVATGYNASNWQNVNAADLKHLLAKPLKDQLSYQTPLDFAKFRAKFIDGIKAQATPDQLQAYQESMDALETKLYGQQFLYYQQIQLLSNNTITLKAEAEPIPAETPESQALDEIISEERQTSTAPNTANTPNTPAANATPVQSLQINLPGINPLSTERSNEILNRAVIDGDPWHQGGAEYRLNIANLVSGGLTPAYELTFENLSFAFSVPFQLSDGRGAILAYVTAPNAVKVRSFHLNPKTGLWHYAPDIIRGPHGEGMAQVGEAYGAPSTLLPVTLQQALNGLVKAHNFQAITAVNPDFLFAGTAVAYNSPQEYREALASGRARGDFYQEVDHEPLQANWQPNGKNKNVPQLISVNANLSPNFQAQAAHFLTFSILAGQVMANAFNSNDNQQIWLFCNDDWGRAWLGNIEIVSPLTSTGCRRDWMNAGDLATPLYENSTKSGNYGDPSDTRKGLVGMWNKYLSKVPLIQEYVSWRSRSQQ